MTGHPYDSSRVNPEGPGLPRGRQISDRLCGCGCGQHTLIARRTRGRDQVRRGEPLRFVRGHNRRRRGTRTCDDATLVMCARCSDGTHPRVCAAGHPSRTARNLCSPCYDQLRNNGGLDRYPRLLRSRGELLDEWEWLRGQGVSFREFPALVGVTFTAWDRAYWRARKAGDRRAVRTEQKARCAA